MFPSGAAGVKARGYLEALGNDPAKVDAAIKMLEAGNTIEQTALALNSSGLASFARTAQDASTVVRDLYNARDAALKASQVNQLAGATTNLNALNQANLPVSNVSPNAPRNVVNQALAAEAEALAAQQAAAAAKVANVSQLETGSALADANAAILKNTTETVTQPAYNAAFAAAPKATIDVSNLDKQFIALADQIQSKIITGHRVTTTELFGISTPGRLGNSDFATEVQVFQTFVIKPSQSQIEKTINKVLKINGLDVNFKIKPYEVKGSQNNPPQIIN
jgi:hypothetical protein